ncbi:MAG TPA: MarR family transcriptional regulator, partial [Segeticoccus sp.]|uniref:GbsR/MarR family transcriptional regulator n=1 Tax=Segeticoccus sp. TaxID=2706531 RepID=UPI002D7F545E
MSQAHGIPPGAGDPRAGRGTPAEEGRVAARADFVERMADELTRAGMQRMASRVMAAVMSSDSGQMTAAELGELLRASPAAISGAVRYLEQVDMVRRSREPGSRRDHFTMTSDVWYEALAHKDGVLETWRKTMDEGAQTLGPDTPAGRRLVEMREFFGFMEREVA